MDALLLAENAVRRPLTSNDPLWGYLDVLAHYLSLNAHDALVQTLRPAVAVQAPAPHEQCPCIEPNRTCPLRRHAARATRYLHEYTPTDRAEYYRWAAHWLGADADRQLAFDTLPPEVVDRWRESVRDLDRYARHWAEEAQR
jgi:hypothetical protein